MKNKRRAVIIVVLAVFVFSAGTLLHRISEYRAAENIYDEAVALAAIPDVEEPPVTEVTEEPENTEAPQVYEDPYADEFANMDFEALREVNEDVIGWISIPDTKLSYPLVQAPDNEYYLERAWNGRKNASGSIFMECRNSFALDDFNTIVYGHRMGNSTMFGSLADYKKQSHWEKHPLIYITNEYGSHAYLIFAVYEAEVTWDTFRIKFESKKEKQAVIDLAVSESVIDTGIIPTTDNNLLTLSTCLSVLSDSDTRLVVQAVQVDLGDSN